LLAGNYTYWWKRRRTSEKEKSERCFGLPCEVNGNIKNCQEQQFSGNNLVSIDCDWQRMKLVPPHGQDHCLALLFLACVNWHQAPPVPQDA